MFYSTTVLNEMLYAFWAIFIFYCQNIIQYIKDTLAANTHAAQYNSATSNNTVFNKIFDLMHWDLIENYRSVKFDIFA